MKLENVQLDDIKMWDYPDFCDAYIAYAEIDGKALSENELEQLNDDRELVMDLVYRRVF